MMEYCRNCGERIPGSDEKLRDDIQKVHDDMLKQARMGVLWCAEYIPPRYPSDSTSNPGIWRSQC